jgi:pimeloyl-ACP methyl ester carboxylesterase
MTVREIKHRVRDIEVRMFRGGGGEPLLFLHGAGGPPPWSAFFAKLASRYDVLVPEHPGFGTAANAEAIHDVADMAMYYLDFLDGLGDGPVHLVGQSLGGWIAAEVAVRNCSRLKSLTLMSPAGVQIEGAPIGDTFGWSAEEAVRNLFHDQSFADARLAQVPSAEEAARRLINRSMAERLGRKPRWSNPALARWLHRISVPALLIWGKDDKQFPSTHATRWRERVPAMRFALIEDCGHLPYVEKADLTAETILKFLGEGRR